MMKILNTPEEVRQYLNSPSDYDILPEFIKIGDNDYKIVLTDDYDGISTVVVNSYNKTITIIKGLPLEALGGLVLDVIIGLMNEEAVFEYRVDEDDVNKITFIRELLRTPKLITFLSISKALTPPVSYLVGQRGQLIVIVDEHSRLMK